MFGGHQRADNIAHRTRKARRADTQHRMGLRVKRTSKASLVETKPLTSLEASTQSNAEHSKGECNSVSQVEATICPRRSRLHTFFAFASCTRLSQS